jgi:hypothetical protein
MVARTDVTAAVSPHCALAAAPQAIESAQPTASEALTRHLRSPLFCACCMLTLPSVAPLRRGCDKPTIDSDIEPRMVNFVLPLRGTYVLPLSVVRWSAGRARPLRAMSSGE